jgi:hypothetical protein
MPTTAEGIRPAVAQRFAQVARSPDQEQKFPVGPASAKKLGAGRPRPEQRGGPGQPSSRPEGEAG